MSEETGTKLNHLINQWPHGTVMVTSILLSMGFSNELLNRYKKGKWIKSIGKGAYALNNDSVEWLGGLYALQNQLGLSIHVGGKTALTMQGFSHYLTMGKAEVFLYGVRGKKLPTWFRKYNWGVQLLYVATNLFPSDCREGFTEYREKEFSISISAPERALMEMLYHVPYKVGFNEAHLIMENFPTLRPKLVEKLLWCCNSIKVKRLFMYMGEKHEHPWVRKVNLEGIDFGKGKRVIVKSGVLDEKYYITVPRNIEREGI